MVGQLATTVSLIAPAQALGELFVVMRRSGASPSEARAIILEFAGAFGTAGSEARTALSAADLVVDHQILYNLTRRGPEHDLLPWLDAEGLPAMAYSPVEQGRLIRDRRLGDIAARIGATPTQVALAWTMRNDNVIAIPKASSVAHVRENRAAADLVLSPADLATLDAVFPRPHERAPLEML